MADVRVDDAALHASAQVIGGVARDFETLAQMAEQNLGRAREAISHAGLIGVLDDILGRAQQAHRTVHDGLTRLGSFASDSVQTFSELDHGLAARAQVK